MLRRLLRTFGHRAVIACGSTVLLLMVVMLAAVFGSGQTLGQRCKAAGIGPDSKRWAECLARLRANRPPPIDSQPADE